MRPKTALKRAIKLSDGMGQGTQQTLAQSAGITQPLISMILSGKRRMRPDTARAIAAALDGQITADQLLPGVGE